MKNKSKGILMPFRNTKEVHPFDEMVTVFSFGEKELAEAFDNGFLTAEEIPHVKARLFHFFLNYLNPGNGGLNASTILVESKYLSKSYLQDYSNYYSTSYVDYKRFCKRIHFFGENFTKEKLEEMLKHPTKKHEDIWQSYLGYIVIRPLSNAIFGATLLRHSITENTNRYFNSIREYKINIFGKELKFKTLVFQEQDKVVGACASSALWSAFHKISMQDVFQTPLLSPSGITKSVKSRTSEFSGRLFPNEILTLDQVLESIDANGLGAELFTDDRIKDIHFLKAITYSYNRMGLPVLLCFQFKNKENHLVTITGYRLNEKVKLTRKKNNLVLMSDKVSEFYAHDDQVGPFAPLRFAKGKIASRFPLITAWIDYESIKPGRAIQLELAAPKALIIPLNDEIRISFINVYKHLLDIDVFFQKFISPKNSGKFITWDIYLEYSNKYKKEVFESKNSFNIPPASERIKRKILHRCMPKYIWVARANIESYFQFELIFDATNVAGAQFCKFINFYSIELSKLVFNHIKTEKTGARKAIAEKIGSKFLLILEEEFNFR